MGEVVRRRRRTPPPQPEARQESSSVPDAPEVEKKWLVLEEYVVERLGQVQTPADLADAVDQLLGDASFSALYVQAMELLPLEAIRQVALSDELDIPIPVPESVAPSEDLVRNLVFGAQLATATANAFLQVVGRIAHKRVADTAKAAGQAPLGARARAPADIVADPRVPAAAMRANLAGWRSEILAIAMVTANRWRPSPELFAEVVSGWVDAQKLHLGFLAAISGVAIPANILREIRILDVTEIQTAHAEAEAGYLRRLAEARASGQDVYPPRGSADE
ncbi:MAG: hypothetical protein AABZ30_15940 [Myxococcota bacterium]